MNTISYVREPERVAQYEQLLKQLYAQQPLHRAFRFASFRSAVDTRNPFLEHGTFTNLLVTDGDDVFAHASVVSDERVPAALVGFLDVATKQAIAPLRQAIADTVRSFGHGSLHGPINFNTWNDFRYPVTATDNPYPLEPFSSEASIEFWEGYPAKFAVEYESFRSLVAAAPFAAYQVRHEALVAAGYTFETLGHTVAEADLRSLYDISLDSFGATWSFTAITYQEFKYQFLPSLAQSDLVRVFVARNSEGRIDAYFVAFLSSGGISKELVQKTIATRGDCQNQGLASALFYEAHQWSLRQGIASYVYATLQRDNQVIHSLVRDTEPLNRYRVIKADV